MGTVVVIAGSSSSVTMGQVSKVVNVLGVEVVDLNPMRLLETRGRGGVKSLEWLRRFLVREFEAGLFS